MTKLMIENLEGRELMSADVVMSFTPPIGSNKGSLVGQVDATAAPSRFAGDGWGVDFLVASKNDTTGTALTDAAFSKYDPPKTGIIAILIG